MHSIVTVEMNIIQPLRPSCPQFTAPTVTMEACFGKVSAVVGSPMLKLCSSHALRSGSFMLPPKERVQSRKEERSAVLFAQVRKHVVNNPEHRDNHSNKQAKAHRDEYAFHGVDCKSMPVNWRNIAIARFDPDKGEEKAQSCESAWLRNLTPLRGLGYSYRSATIGSTRMARRAGM